MTKSVLIAILFISAHSYAAEPGVWEQMESGEINPIEVKIRNLELHGLKVTFERLEESAEPSVQTIKLCTGDAAVNDNNYTEADRAMAINLRVQALLSAKKNKENIKLGLRGPWNPCVYPISI